MIRLEECDFALVNVMMDSGKDHQLVLKPLGQWFLEKRPICALKELPPHTAYSVYKEPEMGRFSLCILTNGTN